MADVRNWLEVVAPAVAGCHVHRMLDAVRAAAAEFCERSLAWTETHADISLVEDQAVYTLTVPTDARLSQVRSAKIDGVPISVTTSTWLDERRPGWKNEEGAAVALIGVGNTDTVQLVPKPKNVSSNKLSLKIAWVPTNLAATLPDFLEKRYRYVIGNAAIGLLKAIPGQPWTSADTADKARKDFDTEIAKAYVEMQHERVEGDIRIVPRRFGG
jgi:hypothetical protein